MKDTVVQVIRKGGCARVLLESGAVLRVPHALYEMRKLYPGREIDPEEYAAWRKTTEYQAALERAVKYIEGRERSEGEVRECLKKSGYEEEAVEKVILTLKENRILSDARFAGLWVDARAQKLGRSRIRAELMHKGIDADTAKAALSGFTEEDELEMAADQARRLMKRKSDPQKLLAALVRKGYSFSVAKAAMKKAGSEEADAEEEY